MKKETIATTEGMSRSIKLSFKDAVKLIEKGAWTDTNNALEVRNTSPEWLVKCGYLQLPMLMTINHIKRGLGIGAKGKQHNVSSDVLAKIPNLLDDPIVAFTSHGNTVVTLLRATDNDGKILLVSIKPEGNGYYNNIEIDTNFITSAYGRNEVVKYYDKVLYKQTLLYPIGKTKKQVMQDILRLQLSNNIFEPVSRYILSPHNTRKQ